MRYKRFLLYTIGGILLLLLLTACTTSRPASTPTPVPPTPTAIQPKCELKCTGSPGIGASGIPQAGIEIRITCESGKATQSTESWQMQTEDRGIITKIEGTRTYEESGNEYEITAEAWLHYLENKTIAVKYHAQVSGGAFGDTRQICTSE